MTNLSELEGNTELYLDSDVIAEFAFECEAEGLYNPTGVLCYFDNDGIVTQIWATEYSAPYVDHAPYYQVA